MVDGRRVEMEKTERPMAESSRGWMQRPETKDDRRSFDRRNDGTCSVAALTTSDVRDTKQLIQVGDRNRQNRICR